MSLSSQDQFEQSYSDFTGHPVAFIKAQRLSNDSYAVPRIATAYTWWKRARAGMVVELPKGGNMWDGEPVEISRAEAVAAIEAVGGTVAP